MTHKKKMKTVLLIESFYGGSHKQLMDLLHTEFQSSTELYTMPGKKWHWRARTSALYFAQVIPINHNFQVLFASSVLNLAELLALRPDLVQLSKVLYFHENQLLYPVEKPRERDFQYGYNQILSCLVADKVVFNSYFNQESFLNSLSSYFTIMPKPRPNDLESKIRPKCSVIYYPLLYTTIVPKETHKSSSKNINVDQETSTMKTECEESGDLCYNSNSEKLNYSAPLHIVWPHRWEHDKNPMDFFNVLFELQKDHIFQLSVIGELFSEIPEIFDKAKEILKKHIVHWGYQENREDYLAILSRADIVVSTANQEFFGVAMLEAVQYGCYPLCPNKLVYPEIYPEEYLYNTSNQLLKKLKRFCKYPNVVRNHKLQIDIEKFQWNKLKPLYRDLLRID